MATPDVSTCFGSENALYLVYSKDANLPLASHEWEGAMVLMVEILPECYALVIKSSNGNQDKVLFSATIHEGLNFACNEMDQTATWDIPNTSNRFALRFRNAMEFWLFVSQFTEACTYDLRQKTNAQDQLQAVLQSFRTFLVVGSALNAVNPFDGKEDRSAPPRMGNHAPADSSEDETV